MAAASRPRSKKKGVGATLRLAGFHRLSGDLQPWRTGVDLKVLEAAKGSALVLPFVKGLRLSAQLIYILREELSATDLEVDWGHLLDDEGESCSPECDIIIHRRGHDGKWDGNDNPVMNFKFVKRERAVAVISCKSYVKGVDAEYVKKLQRYVKLVFLFVECCSPEKADSLRKKARATGYAGFGYLYTFDEKRRECVNDEKGWPRFLDAVVRGIEKAMGAK